MEFKSNTQAFPSAFTTANSLSIPFHYSYSSFDSSSSPFNVNTSTSPFNLTCVNTPSPLPGFVSPLTQYVNYYPNYPSFTPLTPLTPVPLCPGTSSSAKTYNNLTLCSSAVSALQNVPRYSPLLVSSCSPSLHSSLRSTQSHSSSSSSARTQPHPPPPLQPLPAPNVCVSSELGGSGVGSGGTEHLTRCVASGTYYPHQYDALLVKSSFAASQSSQASQAWTAPSTANSFGVSLTMPAVRFSELQVPQSAQTQTLKRQLEAYHAGREQQQWAGLVHTCRGGNGLERGSIAGHHSQLAMGPFGGITSDSALGAANANAPSIDISVPPADQLVHIYNPKYQYDAFYGQEREGSERTREATSGGATGYSASSKRTRVTTTAFPAAAFERHATPPPTSASLGVGVPLVPAAFSETPAAEPVSGLSYDSYECPTNAPARAHHTRQQRGVALGYGQHGFHMDCSGMVLGTGFDAEFGMSGIDREPEHLVKPPFSYIALITMVIESTMELLKLKFLKRSTFVFLVLNDKS